jgi:glycosyltransferase involved in cell wall biosynthesis
MKKDNIFLSIIIPQYNELSNLKKGLLHDAFEYLEKQGFSYEVLIVDDGSSDGSLDYLKENYSDKDFLRIIEAKHGGKPVAINRGIEESTGEYILFTDMDQSTPLSEIDKLLPFIAENHAVIGSRGGKRNSATISRKIAGFLFSSFRKLFLLRQIDDTQCGFKIFRADILKETFPKLNALKVKNVKGWSVSAFDVELLYLIQKKGGKIKEIRVKWNDEDVSGTKNRKFLSESGDMLKQILLVVWREMKGEYV